MRRLLWFLVIASFSAPLAQTADVNEAGRALPVAQQVDVVVVGGSSGGVAAAVAAAKKGVKVFLAAPRPYLGEDICATGRLWLEPGEKPTTALAREVLEAAVPESAVPPGLHFTYTTDVKSWKGHADTTPPSRLADGKWTESAKQSVQYNGDVTVVVDLGKPQHFKKVHVLAYQRAQDFEVGKVIVSASDDQQQWKTLGTITNDKPEENHEDSALDVSAPMAATARYVKLQIQKSAQADRILLGEIVIEGDTPAKSAGAAEPAAIVLTPMQVKRAFDQALIGAGVSFLFGCYATDVLVDGNGRPAGIVMANRSGRQAVIAKVIIDATERGTVTRMTKATFSPYPAGTQTFQRIVIGGPVCKDNDLTVRSRSKPIVAIDRRGNEHAIIEYSFNTQMKDASFASFAAADQVARDLTWTKEQVDASEVLFQVPPDPVRGKAHHAAAWPGSEKIPLDAFRPDGVDNLFVLGGCADVSREAAAELLRPFNLMAVGTRIGEAATKQTQHAAKPDGVRVLASKSGQTAAPGDVREVGPEKDPRHASARTVPSDERGVSVLAEYDVVVVGGGTGGAPAAIAAGRRGAKTLLVEYLHSLGGVGTAGLISIYYHGNRVGFTQEIDAGVAGLGAVDPPVKKGEWISDMKSEWYRREMRKAGVDVWFGVIGAGAFVEGKRVRGITVATPQGRGVVLAKVVIDATGNADIAAAAGAECTYVTEAEVAMQGTGLPPRALGTRYLNTDYTYVDETDIFDIWRAYVMGRQKYKTAYDLGQLIDTRERRRIVGDVTLTPMDALLNRTWPDTIVLAKSNFDTHGYTIHPLFMLRPPDKQDVFVNEPYRCMLPRGFDGIMVIGLGVSAHRDTMPLIRMQPDIQNQGYAVGVAAATLAKTGASTRALDVKALQRHLVEIGNLPASVLTDKDSFPLPKEKYAEAVAQVAKDYQGLEVLLTQPDVAKPLLRDALAAASEPKTKLIYAHILGMLGDNAGADVLMREVAASGWDTGWQFKAMGQFGASLSPLDSLIIALGRTGDKRAVEPLLEKVRSLKPDSEFSHFRAIAMALESLADPAAAKPLAALLQLRGISGHALTDIATTVRDVPKSGTDNATRSAELIELGLARALYQCGDYHGLGEKILRQYAQDLRGHYARHAQAVLAAKR